MVIDLIDCSLNGTTSIRVFPEYSGVPADSFDATRTSIERRLGSTSLPINDKYDLEFEKSKISSTPQNRHARQDTLPTHKTRHWKKKRHHHYQHT